MSLLGRITGVCCALSLSCGALVAPSSAEPLSRINQNDDDWRYNLNLYAFLPVSTTGTSTVAGQSVPLDLDLGDALDLLEFAASGRFEAWRGDFGIIVDANYVGLGADGTLPAGPGVAFDVDIRQRWLGVMGAYRFANGVAQNGHRFAMDLQLGARYQKLRQEVTLTPPGAVLGGDPTWWEPVIGARGMWELNDKWAAMAALEFGGFGAGGNDLQVSATVGLDWLAWERTSLFFGYRYFSMDYSETLPTGAFAFDVEEHGPVIGVKIRF